VVEEGAVSEKSPYAPDLKLQEQCSHEWQFTDQHQDERFCPKCKANHWKETKDGPWMTFRYFGFDTPTRDRRYDH
jgi:hypothetical protein